MLKNNVMTISLICEKLFDVIELLGSLCLFRPVHSWFPLQSDVGKNVFALRNAT